MPTLKTQIDSLNYAFGLANGNGIKQYYLAKDSANADSIKVKIPSLLKGLNEGRKGEGDEHNDSTGSPNLFANYYAETSG